MQVRLRKFIRQPERLAFRALTDRSLTIIATLDRYRILPTSLLVQLTPGNPRVTAQHLQSLYHQGYINRFAFPRFGNPGEFHYFLDSPRSLQLLVEENHLDPATLDWETVRTNREKPFPSYPPTPTTPYDPAQVEDLQGRLLYLKHEVMISRFHALLELGCRRSAGTLELATWRQGPVLHHTVTAPISKSTINRAGEKIWYDSDDQETLPHRPDAFFTLRFLDDFDDPRELSFLYEADRKRSSARRMLRKFRAHGEFVVRQRKHKDAYRVDRIRAVLVETLDPGWMEHLRQLAAHPTISGRSLFWFTHSINFTGAATIPDPQQPRPLPRYLYEPQCIFSPVWLTPRDNTPHTLLEA